MGRQNLPLSIPPILANVAAPTVAPQGAGGSDTWEYTIVGVTAGGGRSLVSSAGTSAAGSAALNDSDFNRVTWTDVAGYERYEIFRSTAADAIGEGLVGVVGAGVQVFDDVGHVVDDAVGSAANTTGDGPAVDLTVFSGPVEAIVENIGVGTYEVQSSQDRAAWTIEGAALTADGVRTVAIDKRWLRVQCTAFTSGTPRAFATGDAG